MNILLVKVGTIYQATNNKELDAIKKAFESAIQQKTDAVVIIPYGVELESICVGNPTSVHVAFSSNEGTQSYYD